MNVTRDFYIGDVVEVIDPNRKGTLGVIVNAYVQYDYNLEQYWCYDIDIIRTDIGEGRTYIEKLTNIPKRYIKLVNSESLAKAFRRKHMLIKYPTKNETSETETKHEYIDYMHASKIKLQPLKVKKVIFNGNRTIVIFDNGTKSIVKCEGERFDKEKGLAMALVKAMYGTNESNSNYYNIFKKWIPEEETPLFNSLPEEVVAYCEKDAEAVKEVLKTFPKAVISNELARKGMHKEVEKAEQEILSTNPCTDCEEAHTGCFKDCEKLQEKADEISGTEEKKPQPIEPGYFIKHNEERKEKPKLVSKTVKEQCEDFVNSHPNDIHAFVSRFSAAYFPSDFLKFCRDNNLYFYITDRIKGMKPIDPFTVTWQEVTGYLKRGLMVSCKKTKNNKAYLAVVMADNLFSMLPIELRKENRKENRNE